MKNAPIDVRKLTQTAGTTYYVTLPKYIVKRLKWRKGQRVTIEQRDDEIVIKDFKN